VHLSEHIFQKIDRDVSRIRVKSIGWNTCGSQDRFERKGSRRCDDRCRHLSGYHRISESRREWKRLRGAFRTAPRRAGSQHSSAFRVLVHAHIRRREAVRRPRFLFFLPLSRGETLASRLRLPQRTSPTCVYTRLCSLSLSLSIPPPRLSLFPRYRSLSQDKREEHESRSGEAGRQDAFSTPVALSRRARTRVVGRATRGDAEVGPSQEERRLRERERERDRSSSPVD